MNDPILAAYRSRLERKRVEPATLINAVQAHTRFGRYLDEIDRTAATITPLEMEEYFDQLQVTLAPTTVRSHLTQIGAAYRYAQKLGTITRNPTVDVPVPRLPDVEPETFTNDGLRSIWQACENVRDRLLFIGLAYTGVRDHELRLLKWCDVDLPRQQMTVLGKGKKIRLVPIHPLWAEALAKAQPNARTDYVVHTNRNFGNRPVTYRHQYEQLQRLLGRAGVEGSAHVFRKTVATVLDEEDVRESVIDEIMGWAPRTVRRRHYTRLRPERVYQGMLALYRSDPIITDDGGIWDLEIQPRRRPGVIYLS
jgi:integrase/recombinase XerD